MAEVHQISKWHYNTHVIVTCIPPEIGRMWEIGYGVELQKFECVPATSYFSGQHAGDGLGPQVLLARSEVGYCLLDARKEKINES